MPMLEKSPIWKRLHLFDRARLIADTVGTNVLPIFLVVGGVVALPRVAEVGAAIGINGAASRVVLSVLLAALVLPARRWLQLTIGRPAAAGQLRTIQAALRPYISEAVAWQLESGCEARRECEISVLFADMRGFTSFCEHHTPLEIFAIVNRFTEQLCHIVRQHGGHVVEFNGDGIMAVFGAPDALVNKERAAVEAGRRIVEATKSMAEGSGPAVGVGIATGTDFVGNIQASHLIWTAIGNTSNLAARLQDLTKEVNASMVIDGQTHAALAGEVSVGFEHKNVPIRGRHNREDVYLFPLSQRSSDTVLSQAGVAPGEVGIRETVSADLPLQIQLPGVTTAPLSA
jgi:class 3 adenylate cyclase